MRQGQPAAFEAVSEIVSEGRRSAKAAAGDGRDRRAGRASVPRLVGYAGALDLFFILSGFLIAGIPIEAKLSAIDGTYESHSAMRVTGIVLMSTLIPIGAVLALIGAEAGASTCTIGLDGSGTEQCTTSNSDSGVIAAGVVALGTGLLLGIAFAVRHDATAVQVVPLATAPVAVRGGASERAPSSNGLALRFAF